MEEWLKKNLGLEFSLEEMFSVTRKKLELLEVAVQTSIIDSKLRADFNTIFY